LDRGRGRLAGPGSTCRWSGTRWNGGRMERPHALPCLQTCYGRPLRTGGKLLLRPKLAPLHLHPLAQAKVMVAVAVAAAVVAVAATAATAAALTELDQRELQGQSSHGFLSLAGHASPLSPIRNRCVPRNLLNCSLHVTIAPCSSHPCTHVFGIHLRFPSLTLCTSRRSPVAHHVAHPLHVTLLRCTSPLTLVTCIPFAHRTQLRR
jgi:hypothetical protein